MGVARSLVERLIGYDLRKSRPQEPSSPQETMMRLSGVPEIDERVLREYSHAHFRRFVHNIRTPLARWIPMVLFAGTIAYKALLPDSDLEGFDVADKYLIGGLAIHALDYLIFDMITPAMRRRRSLQNVEIPDSY